MSTQPTLLIILLSSPYLPLSVTKAVIIAAATTKVVTIVIAIITFVIRVADLTASIKLVTTASAAVPAIAIPLAAKFTLHTLPSPPPSLLSSTPPILFTHLLCFTL